MQECGINFLQSDPREHMTIYPAETPGIMMFLKPFPVFYPEAYVTSGPFVLPYVSRTIVAQDDSVPEAELPACLLPCLHSIGAECERDKMLRERGPAS